MSGQDVPRCVACDYNLSVEHVLIECGDFTKLDKDIMMLRVYNSYSRKPVLYMYLTSCVR